MLESSGLKTRMENKKSAVEVRLNGIRTDLTETVKNGVIPNGEPQANSSDVKYGGARDVAKNTNASQSSEKKTFKSVVQRHFVKKDKLFVLVHDLLKSIDDEKQAQEDLLTSFRIAREITEPIRRQSVASIPHRVRRRKRRDDTPLLERIQQTRRQSLQPLEDIAIYDKNVAAVGELKVKANESDENDLVNNNYKGDKTGETLITSSMKPPSATERDFTAGSNKRVIGSAINDSVSSDTDSSSSKTRQRAKSSPAGEREKISASNQINKEGNTREVDQLVLDSVLQENEVAEGENTECSDKENTNTSDKVNKPEDVTTVRTDESECSELTVEVETDSDSSQEEANIKVIGANDENDNDFSDDGFDDNIDEFKKLNDPNFHISVMEYNRAPASLYPSLDPIAEASSESFQSMPTSSRDSSSVIEIESKRSSLRWIDVDHANNSSYENKRSYTGHSVHDVHEKSEADRFDMTRPYKTRNNTRNVVSEKGEENGKENDGKGVVNSESKDKTREENSYIKYAEYTYDDQSDTDDKTEKAKNDSGCTNAKHRHKHKSGNGHYQSNRNKKNDHCNEFINTNGIDSKDMSDERDKKKRSKSKDSSNKKSISVDILGMFEENADLQRVSRSEIITPKQSVRTEKSKSKRSPKRSRSTSPRKKRGHERRKHDLTPLPPGYKSSSDSRNRYTNSAHRSKTDYPSRASSTSSCDDVKEAYKTLQTMKDERRYRKPDAVLWERLEISEADVNDRLEKVKWADRCDNRKRYAGVTEEDRKGNSEMDGRRITWNIPIYEQIKNIKGSKNVPDISKLSKTIPREERVGRLYIDLKQERRASGFSDCRPLSAPRQTRKFDEFTHL